MNQLFFLSPFLPSDLLSQARNKNVEVKT